MDNIASNIEKYADKDFSVKISYVEYEGSVGFSVQNKVLSDDKKVESHRIGIESIKSMMEQMKGSCGTYLMENDFEIKLLFPVFGYGSVRL